MDDILAPNTTGIKKMASNIKTRHIAIQNSTSAYPNNFGNFSDFNITAILGPPRDSLLIVVPMTIIYVLIFITGVIGNISTCIVIKKNRSMHTATNYYLFSLAISDFLLLLSGVPQEIYFIWSKYPYVFGELFCIGRGFIAETAANATVLTITAFTVERYVAICHPFLAHAMSKLNRATRIILLIWLTSIITAVPQAAQFGIINVNGISRCDVIRVIIEHSFQLSTFIFFFAPMLIILVLYLLIGFKLHQTNVMRSTNGNILYRATNTHSMRTQSQRGTKRVLKMLVSVVIAFLICWAPFHAQRLIAVYGDKRDQKEQDSLIVVLYTVMTYVSGVLYYLSTCINPLLYNIMSNKFREAFKETLDQCHLCTPETREQEQKYNVLSRPERIRVNFQESTDYASSSQREESFPSTSSSWKYNDSVIEAHGISWRTSDGNHLNAQVESVELDQSASSIVRIDKIDLPSKDATLNVLYTKQGDIQIRLFRKPLHDKKSRRFQRFWSFMTSFLRKRPNSSHMGFYTPPVDDSSSLCNIPIPKCGNTLDQLIPSSACQTPFDESIQFDSSGFHE